MTLDQFVTEYNGKSVLYAPSPARESLRGQCVQLAAFYCQDVLKSPIIWKDAAEWWYQFNLENYFDLVSKHNLKRGDIVVWDRNLPNSGGAGHIAIVLDAPVGGATFTSFDSNWGGKYAHTVTHNYNYVIGGLRPEPAKLPTQGDEAMAIKNPEFIRNMYRYVGGREATTADINLHMNGTPESLLNGFIANNDLAVRHLESEVTRLQGIATRAEQELQQLRTDEQAEDIIEAKKDEEIKQLKLTHANIDGIKVSASQPTATHTTTSQEADEIDQKFKEMYSKPSSKPSLMARLVSVILKHKKKSSVV